MRIVAAIGGSILIQEFDSKKFKEYAEILKSISEDNELFVVVGGGKPAREYIKVVRDLNCGEAKCDDIGIEVTRINAKLLLSALEDVAYQKVPHNFQEALEGLAQNSIEFPKISEKPSFNAPDSFWYARFADFSVKPCVISCPQTSKAVSGLLPLVELPSP